MGCFIFLAGIAALCSTKQLYDTCHARHRMGGFQKGYPVALLVNNSFEAKSLQLSLTACCLARTVLNIWSHLRLPDVCYPVADLPCQDGSLTRWNDRPCSAALPFPSYWGRLTDDRTSDHPSGALFRLQWPLNLLAETTFPCE